MREDVTDGRSSSYTGTPGRGPEARLVVFRIKFQLVSLIVAVYSKK